MSRRRVLGAARVSRAVSWWIVVLEASVLRWCRPALAGDLFVPFGARRRHPFLREGPNGFVLRVEAEFPPSVFTSRMVVTTSSRTEFPTVRLLSSGRARVGRRRRGGETSRQRQGAHRAEETGR
ncbi:hypothetical protein Taro_053222 [Colocasia esculenta]|uniref:Uncharacterized protein n=1 Tax=Colocasia esculenta TaxID=4460 RepID=A0A843XLJ8_COLES|nr:hypothetical protein [Colocasia esculenta]